MKILFLEDNDDLREGWLAFFSSQGHHVRGVALVEELLECASEFAPDVYAIDLNLPDGDGLEVVRKLRAVHPRAGVIVTTARGQIGDRVLGYDSGADMYLTKPIDPRELQACALALFKRLTAMVQTEETPRLHLENHLLVGPRASLTPAHGEAVMLAGFIRAAGQPLARWELARLVDPNQELPSEATLEMRIARLRKKLVAVGLSDKALRVKYGVGYYLCESLVLR